MFPFAPSIKFPRNICANLWTGVQKTVAPGACLVLEIARRRYILRKTRPPNCISIIDSLRFRFTKISCVSSRGIRLKAAVSYIPRHKYSLTGICKEGHIRTIMLATFRALAEPNRFHIVELLRDGPRPVGHLVRRLRLRQPQVSKHLRVLSDAGLVDVRVDAQRRIYTLRPAPLRELEVWLERYRRLWEGNFQRLDTLLGQLKAADSKTKKKKHARTKR
jgi:DNA-binding transcriptional ArsR family regulator